MNLVDVSRDAVADARDTSRNAYIGRPDETTGVVDHAVTAAITTTVRVLRRLDRVVTGTEAADG
jgi:hypothetical protein